MTRLGGTGLLADDLYLLAHHEITTQRQGQGTGTALLRAYHATLDKARVPDYLEDSDFPTRQFYPRPGYTDHGLPVQLPDDGPHMYPLWRECRPPAGQQIPPLPRPIPKETHDDASR